MSWTSSERLMYVQFTTSVHGVCSLWSFLTNMHLKTTPLLQNKISTGIWKSCLNLIDNTSLTLSLPTQEMHLKCWFLPHEIKVFNQHILCW